MNAQQIISQASAKLRDKRLPERKICPECCGSTFARQPDANGDAQDCFECEGRGYIENLHGEMEDD